MTDDEPPPWARPSPPEPHPAGETEAAPATGPDRADQEPLLPDPKAGPASRPTAAAPEPEAAAPPLFTDGSDQLFSASAARPRTPEPLPAAPRAARHLRPEIDHAAGTTGAPLPWGQATPSGPASGPPPAGQPPPGQPSPGQPPPGRRPPPTPAPTTPPTSDAPADPPDPRVGVIAGPIQKTTAQRTFPSFTVLLIAAAVTVAAVVLRALTGGLPAALFAVGLLGPLAAIGAVRLGGRGSSVAVTVHRFEIQPAGGRRMSCAIEGDVPPEALHTGDIVRVNGRPRDGLIAARSADVLASLDGPVIRAIAAKAPPGVVIAEGVNYTLATLMLAGAAVLLLRG